MPEQKENKLNKVIWVLLLLSLVSVILAVIKLSFVLWLWIILIIWLVIWLSFFFSKIFKVMLYFWAVFIIWLVFSILVSFGVIINSGSSDSDSAKVTGTGADGISLSDCTSTMSDTPQMLEGFQAAIYSAALTSDSPNPDKANNIRTFSYKGIKDKTEANSMYVRIDKADMGTITGYTTAMEVCNSDNKANYSYVTSSSDTPAGENVVASVHYFHGGQYLFGPGTYRIDTYIKDLSGKWHLLNRLNGIEVTE